MPRVVAGCMDDLQIDPAERDDIAVIYSLIDRDIGHFRGMQYRLSRGFPFQYGNPADVVRVGMGDNEIVYPGFGDGLHIFDVGIGELLLPVR